jgi:hypothetical protein
MNEYLIIRQGAAISTATMAFAAIIIVVTAGVGAISFTSQPAPSTRTITTGIFEPPTGNLTSSMISSNGLRLTLSLARSMFPQGSGVSMNVSLINTLTTRNNLTMPGGRISLGLGPCGQLPLSVGVFKGNYDVGNLSEGNSLGLYYPGLYMCPALFPIGFWSFAPGNDNVTLVSPQPTGAGNANAPKDMWTQRARANLEYWGYWSGQATGYPSGNAAFVSFQPGTYTVAAQDAWGDATVLHFQIVNDQNALDCATIALNSSFIGHTVDYVGPGPLKLGVYYAEHGNNSTFVLALTAAGGSNETLTFLIYTPLYSSMNSQLSFDPDPSRVQSWQYFTQDGAMVYPATFYPNQCSLLRVIIPQNSTEIHLRFEFSDNQAQTFTLKP